MYAAICMCVYTYIPITEVHKLNCWCVLSIPDFWQSFLGFGSSAEIVIDLDEVDKRKKVDIKTEDGKKEKLPLYLDGESVTGKVGVVIVEGVCECVGVGCFVREGVWERVKGGSSVRVYI